jgi:hypothetical protein
MGLIHRDISPENIMLSQDHHGKLLVKVIDFGIAKQLAEGDGGQGLTQTGMFLGKLKYASPEQAGFLKEGENLDPRSDLYSFGIVLYEMLAGRAPFQATNPHGYILKHVTEKPAPISELNAAAKVPPQLETIIMRSLEKQRENRFETAADFASALENVRTSIAPDQKYGLGEKMITLSGAQTLADLPKITGTQPQVTSSGAQPTQQTFAGGAFGAGTLPGAMVPGGTMPGGTMAGGTMPGGAVSQKTIGSNDPTVMERLGTVAAPTTVEPKWTPPAAEATVLERQIDMTPAAAAAPVKKKKGRAVLAVVAIAIVVGILAAVFTLREEPPAIDTPVAASTAGSEVTSTGTARTQPIAGDQGVLLLSASPWGDLDRIVSKSDQKEIVLTDDNRSTPARIALEPGAYSVTVKGPEGAKTIDVDIQAGKSTTHNVPMGGVDFDQLTDELTRQQ